MNLSSNILDLIADPYLEMFSLLVFERLTVESVMSGIQDWSLEEWQCFNDARDKQRLIHEQRKGE